LKKHIQGLENGHQLEENFYKRIQDALSVMAPGSSMYIISGRSTYILISNLTQPTSLLCAKMTTTELIAISQLDTLAALIRITNRLRKMPQSGTKRSKAAPNNSHPKKVRNLRSNLSCD